LAKLTQSEIDQIKASRLECNAWIVEEYDPDQSRTGIDILSVWLYSVKQISVVYLQTQQYEKLVYLKQKQQRPAPYGASLCCLDS
tara:strand:- start:452 stop:706 length:255 start_codon:yes stop_codon:yes gene_type:complete